jgi:hypothetical protein
MLIDTRVVQCSAVQLAPPSSLFLSLFSPGSWLLAPGSSVHRHRPPPAAHYQSIMGPRIRPPTLARAPSSPAPAPDPVTTA